MGSFLQILIVVHILIFRFRIGLCSGQIHAIFTRNKGKYLANSVIQTTKTDSEFDCSTLCSRDDSCLSVNYMFTGENQGTCELNSKTLDNSAENEKEIEEFVNLGIVKKSKIGHIRKEPSIEAGSDIKHKDAIKCLINDKCQNGGTCFNQTSEPYYVCSCPENYVGANCQTVLSASFTTANVGCDSQFYTIINEPDRLFSYTSTATSKCDSTMVPGWKMFLNGESGAVFATSCPNLAGNRCSTHATGYMVGTLPTVEEGIVTRKTCFCYVGLSCWKEGKDVRVQNCEGYYLFDLLPAPACSYRYCIQ